MSELIDNNRLRKETLKHLILQLHEGAAPEAVRTQLQRLMGEVPYGMVVEVEQELIEEGTLPMEEVQKLCDVHSQALRGVIDVAASPETPAGHPVDVFRRENRGMEALTGAIARNLAELKAMPADAPAADHVARLAEQFQRLRAVDRHYRRKENLLFPHLEKRGITGPSSVMWGKDDEARKLLANAEQSLRAVASAPGSSVSAAMLHGLIATALEPAAATVEEMIYKEEQILFPMSLDQLTEAEWRQIAAQSPEIGFCFLDAVPVWPESDMGAAAPPATGTAGAAGGSDRASAGAPDGGPALEASAGGDTVRMPSGSLTAEQITALLNTIPFDLTFVDADDRVAYFTQGAERVFDRNLSIIGRKVQQCHPPSSVHVVETIVEDFRAGRQDRAAFWIELHGRFVHIEYFAVRSPEKKYLGTLEVTKDITAWRVLRGERRLLSYESPGSPSTDSAASPPASGSPASGSAASGSAALDPAAVGASSAGRSETVSGNAPRKVVLSFDARPLLARGEHPLAPAMEKAARLAPGETMELIAPFEPVPLIMKMREQGFDVEVDRANASEVRTYISRPLA